MGINGGRSLRGIEEEGYVRYNISLPPSLSERPEKYRTDEERPGRGSFKRRLTSG